MGQVDVIKVLKKKRKWMTTKEIAELLGINPSNVNAALLKLFHQGEVLRREAKKQHKPYEYKLK